MATNPPVPIKETISDHCRMIAPTSISRIATEDACDIRPCTSLAVAAQRDFMYRPMPSGSSIIDDQRLRDVPRVHVDTGQEQRQYERHVDDGHHHQQHHRAHRERGIALRDLSELGQERRAGRGAHDDQTRVDVLIQIHHRLDSPHDEGRRNEVDGERQNHQTQILQRLDDCGDREAQAHREHGRHDEHQRRQLDNHAKYVAHIALGKHQHHDNSLHRQLGRLSPAESGQPPYRCTPDSGSRFDEARSGDRFLVPESGGDGRCDGRSVTLDVEMSAKPTDEIGMHRIYDTVRNAVGAATSETERVNRS